MLKTIKQLLVNGTQKLAKVKIPSADLDAEVLLAHSIEKPKEFLYAYPEHIVHKAAETRFIASLKRRLQREPIAYIINKKEFYGLDFYVDSRVLIPRPESERLVQGVIGSEPACSAGSEPIIVIDIGTGSGCIIVSLVKEISKIFPKNKINFIATDISSDALEVAKINAKKHKVDKCIKFYQGDLLEPMLLLLRGGSKATDEAIYNMDNKIASSASPRGDRASPPRNDNPHTTTVIIIANLPYITPNTYQTLSPEIKKYEPKLALLTPDENPNYYYQKLDKQIKKLQKITKAKIWKFYEHPITAS